MGWLSKIRAWLDGEEKPVRHPVDYGDGLIRMPDPDPDSGQKYDPLTGQWITYAEAARAMLDLYEKQSWIGRDDIMCPRCSEVANDGHAAYLSEAHPKADARRRWAVLHREHLGMIEAFGECRCGQRKTLYEAAREAQIFNAPYLGRMG